MVGAGGDFCAPVHVLQYAAADRSQLAAAAGGYKLSGLYFRSDRCDRRRPLQLVLSVAMLAETAGIAGVRTAAMYLSAEELGRKHLGMIPKILSSCTIYSVICGGVVSAALYGGAPLLAEHWINDLRTVGGFAPVCACAAAGVYLRGFTGLFCGFGADWNPGGSGDWGTALLHGRHDGSAHCLGRQRPG